MTEPVLPANDIGVTPMKTNQFGVEIKEVEWYSAEYFLKAELEDKRAVLYCTGQKGEIKLFLSFPTGGGVRLCSENAGYFEPNDLKEIAATYSDDKIRLSDGSGTSVYINNGKSAIHIEITVEALRKRLLIEGSQIMFGYDGESLCKAAYSSFLAENEGIYGFGERFNTLNHRGTQFSLWNADCWSKGVAAYKNMPIFHSTAGYMMFFNSFYNCEADIGKTDPDKMLLEFEGPKWDAYFFLGTPAENIRMYTELTGKPILPPKWALRYWAGGAYQVWDEKSGPENYLEALEETLRKYAEMGMPDIAALGGEGKPMNNEPAYEILKKTGTRMIGWNHPSLLISEMAELLGTDELREIPYFMNPDDRTKQAGREVIDFAHPNAVKVVSAFFRKLWDWGLKGCMVDYGEILPVKSLSSNGMTGDEMHNGVSYWYNKAYHDAWYGEMGNDCILFSRSGCAGCQKWVGNFGGDQVSSFEGLNQAINGMLNLTSCGFSVWGTDIGGYGGPPTPEVYIRWLQFGTFNPLMRAHGAGLDRDPWTYGDTAIRVFCKMYWIRENLLDCIYSSAVRAHTEGIPTVMNMAAAFPEEGIAPDVNGQYMFCERLLVCPVLEEGANKKEIVFPSGSWYGLFGGERVLGGVTKTVSAEIEDIPVYIRAGSVIPIRLGESGELAEPVYSGSCTPALLITPPDISSVGVIYSENTAKKAYCLKAEEGGCELQWERQAAYRKLILYADARKIHITVDGKAVDKKYIRSDVCGRVIADIPAESWKTARIGFI